MGGAAQLTATPPTDTVHSRSHSLMSFFFLQVCSAAVSAGIDLPSDPQNLVFVYCRERNVCPRRPARHTAAAAAAAAGGRTASSTNHHRAPRLHMSTASAGGVGR